MHEVLIKQLDSLLHCLVSCWHLSPQFHEYVVLKQLDWKGLLEFEFDEFNHYNKEMLAVIEKPGLVNDLLLQFLKEL